MIWFLPLIGSFLGGFAVGAAIGAGIGYLLDKYPNARYAIFTLTKNIIGRIKKNNISKSLNKNSKSLNKKIKGSLKSGRYNADDDSLGLNVVDENMNHLGDEQMRLDKKTGDFLSRFEPGKYAFDVDTGDVYECTC